MQTHSLIPLLTNKRRLKKAARLCMRRKSCPGVDKEKWKTFRNHFEDNLDSLCQQLKNDSWSPSPLLHKKVKKFSGKEFEFVIPNISDRIVQRHVRNIIEPILNEKGFQNFVSGFRAKKSRITSLRQANVYLKMGKIYVVDVDIKDISNGISVDELIDLLAKYISDGKFLNITKKILTSLPRPLMPGCGLTPLLITARLIPLDNLVASMSVVRFADNYCFFCPSKDEANLTLQKVTELVRQSKLQLAEDKTNVHTNPNVEDLFLL